jgi:hypothetical protein
MPRNASPQPTMSSQLTFVAMHVLLTVLATLFLGARFFAKSMNQQQLQYSPDDILLLLALVTLIFMDGLRSADIITDSGVDFHVPSSCWIHRLHVHLPD